MRALAVAFCSSALLRAAATPSQQRLGGRGSHILRLVPETADASGTDGPWALEEVDLNHPPGVESVSVIAYWDPKKGNETFAWLPKDWTKRINNMTQNINFHVLLVPVLLGFALVILIVSSLVATGNWKREDTGAEQMAGSTEEREPRFEEAPASPMSVPTLHKWSVAGIVALTSYRFYTGFLSATWMPYLLAMEGHQLMGHRQSIFMGSAKLIYGTSILLNPMFGLMGDQMAVVSHWSGRRLFVLLGVGAGGLGIYGCVVAAQIESVWWYLAATVLWMLGEAMADVTTETLVPELLPRSQYELSSAIRALNFLLGGLVGYGALIAFRHFHYSWLYYGYLLVMIVCAFFTLCFINTDDLGGVSRPNRRKETSLSALVTQAYYLPAQLDGGFPKACLCLFVFSLGSAPMFFLLLMVRDIIGIKEHVTMQMHFSLLSIAFFVSAALASVMGAAAAGAGGGDGGAPSPPESRAAAEGGAAAGPEAGAGSATAPTEDKAANREALISRWRLMVLSTILFGAVAAAIPLVGLMPTVDSRKVAFYVVAILFGFSFGSVYARFQECTWSLLPSGVDVANAMGYAAMCKLAGVGIGNFFAGIILDCSALSSEDSDAGYSLTGYLIMCFICAGVVLLSGYLAHGVSQVALANYDKSA
mmetsp:Transcript_139197/g.388397  ORF Transcript_139197/g.388397 Transcript_139197/m.388397 type:complete len:648 (-) Transcript_139197:81-2024(-)|eukprot:CAMPEP_0179066024 /NCGR_PEP_ID=MMETSP0796-20121207/28767_1 /TAXON_ID=73915 /ORGANISM="Pyrodinium bahamense, Strain pbaha01" /LENGTH=647 /DNA_ID=CAMNT_0020763023 /DNA_START=48 /DNA_END=1991 /DNA_ORIENTATION=-